MDKLLTEIDVENKSTKEVILEYLKINSGREIAVREISERFDYKLNRISNAIKELELVGEIIIERRPLKKGKYTVIRLRGDIINEYASHEDEINPKQSLENNSSKTDYAEGFQIKKALDLLSRVDYTQSIFKKMIEDKFENHYLLITQVIQPLLYEVGKLWQDGKIMVADEHLISYRLEKLLIDLIAQQSKRSYSKTIILSPVENEFHTLVLLTLELLLLERGFNVINLSRTISILSVINFIKKMKSKPDWIFFSITTSTYINNLKMDIRLIREDTKLKNLKIAIGGQGLNNISSEHFIGVDKIIKTNEELHKFLLSL